MNTLRLKLDPNRLDRFEGRKAIGRAAEILRSGGLVATPTETVYGLAANALDATAVARIFAAKERPTWDPIIVHIAGQVVGGEMLDNLVTEIPEAAQKLMRAFWPGPLTLLLPRSTAVPDSVTASRPMVGVRMPAHPVAFELIRKAGVPLAAPSANLFGHTSPTTAEHVLDDLDGRIDAILDAGPTLHGVESTVVDPCQEPLVIYRPGAITADEIRRIAGPAKLFQTSNPLSIASMEALPSPGVGLRHYAPRARLALLEVPLDRLPSRLSEAVESNINERIGLMLFSEFEAEGRAFPGVLVFPWGHSTDSVELAHNLFAGLRSLDAQGCTLIICPLPTDSGIGTAIRDRLRKAAQPSEK
ncbi:MAG TPA: L-threonylcarbamoyladenylate synthase [Terracidiphilus sp.]|nr:L-threonylcarbamoyladenylate synthase [Terracidiphilus sp.]